MTVTTIPVHQSRWGFHPYTREECKELKQAHKTTLQALRVGLRYHRWYRKQEQNRPVKSPPVTPAMESHIDLENGCSEFKVFYLQLLAVYRNARRPQATPQEVVFMVLPLGWKEVATALSE